MRTSPDVSSLIVLVALLSAACTPAPLDFADWTIPVPEGTPIIEYAAVPMEERTERIELVEDLVIGRDSVDPNYAFYRPRDLAVSSAGWIYVLDDGNHRVQVFDGDGDYQMTLGQQGEGPGELVGSSSITVVAGSVIVSDWRKAQLSIWNTQGVHLRDVRLSFARNFSSAMGLNDGSLFVSYFEPDYERGGRAGDLASLVVARVSADLDILHTYAAFPIAAPSLLPVAYPLCAASADGDVYVTDATEYQVLALSAEGMPNWVLSADLFPAPISKAYAERRWREFSVKNQGKVARSKLAWPDRYPALSWIGVDGHGHLYVFPFIPDSHNDTLVEWPVDVYSRTGERLFSGLIPKIGIWEAALNDEIYRIEEDPVSNEEIAVRYRLVEPF